MSEGLFTMPRRKAGSHEAALAKMLRAWHKDGYLQGDSWASHRILLRTMARAVDQAEKDLYEAEGSPYSLSRTAKVYFEALAAVGKEEVGSGDAIDDLIASITGSAPVRDQA